MKAEVVELRGSLGDRNYFALLIDGTYIMRMPEGDYFRLVCGLDEDDPRRTEIAREYFETMAANINGGSQ